MAQLNYNQAVRAMENRQAFKGNTLWAQWENGEYCVYSYRTLMLRENAEGVWFNETKYSVTTSKHQNYIRRAFNL